MRKRYIKRVGGQTVEWPSSQGKLSSATMINSGWSMTTSTLPVSRLDIVDGIVMELPPPPEINIYAEWYRLNPDLEKRVREFLGYLQFLGLPEDVTVTRDDVVARTSEIFGDDMVKRAAIEGYMKATMDDISLNLEYLDVHQPNVTAWAKLPELIDNLPVREESDPVNSTVTDKLAGLEAE